MTEQQAMNVLVRHHAKWVDEALRDNPDGPVVMLITRTKTEIDYEVVIGDPGAGDHGRARTVWHDSVAFGNSDAHCGGGTAFVAAARVQDEVAFAALELMELRR
jgi:hypothetical protein